MCLNTLRLAMRSVLSNKMRSFLTMLGIIIGVVALVVLVSLVNGATGAVTSEITALGNDMVTVTIKDSSGTVVRTIDEGSMSSGTQALSWDGLQDDGTTAADGAYTVELTALAEGETDIRDLLMSDDVERMLEALRALGVDWRREGDRLLLKKRY